MKNIESDSWGGLVVDLAIVVDLPTLNRKMTHGVHLNFATLARAKVVVVEGGEADETDVTVITPRDPDSLLGLCQGVIDEFLECGLETVDTAGHSFEVVLEALVQGHLGIDVVLVWYNHMNPESTLLVAHLGDLVDKLLVLVEVSPRRNMRGHLAVLHLACFAKCRERDARLHPDRVHAIQGVALLYIRVIHDELNIGARVDGPGRRTGHQGGSGEEGGAKVGELHVCGGKEIGKNSKSRTDRL